MLAAPLPSDKLRFDCEPLRLRPKDDRLREPPLPDDKSPNDPLGFERKLRSDVELPFDEPRFMLPGDRLNDSRLLRVNERPLSPPAPMLTDGLL
jgi:hypothetical protein